MLWVKYLLFPRKEDTKHWVLPWGSSASKLAFLDAAGRFETLNRSCDYGGSRVPTYVSMERRVGAIDKRIRPLGLSTRTHALSPFSVNTHPGTEVVMHSRAKDQAAFVDRLYCGALRYWTIWKRHAAQGEEGSAGSAYLHRQLSSQCYCDYNVL
jgi:hypothetical protein